MIGLGPHTMSTADWVFLGALQIGLILAAVFAINVAFQAPRPRSGR